MVRSDAVAWSSDGVEHGRILVAMARFVGAGFIAYLLISIPMFGANAALVDRWYTPVAVILAFGPGIALLPATFSSAGRRAVPVLAGACAAGYLLATGLWFLAWNGNPSTTEPVTWLNAFSGLPSLAVALVSLRPAIATLITSTAVAAAITVSGRAIDIANAPYVYELLWGVLFTLPFMLATRMVVRTGTVLDETRADAARAAADSASAAARNTERARFDALVHDSVIGTLVAVKAHPDDDRLPGQARSALDELEYVDREDDADLSLTETLARLRTVAAAAAPDVPVGVDQDPALDPTGIRYPADAVRAISEAMGEALRNSLMHAGVDAHRAILIALDATSLTVTVGDDGVGFHLDAVPPERLGIAISIHQRVNAVPGALAVVQSSPGDGTAVSLRCRAI